MCAGIHVTLPCLIQAVSLLFSSKTMLVNLMPRKFFSLSPRERGGAWRFHGPLSLSQYSLVPQYSQVDRNKSVHPKFWKRGKLRLILGQHTLVIQENIVTGKGVFSHRFIRCLVYSRILTFFHVCFVPVLRYFFIGKNLPCPLTDKQKFC
jgi:hypothetical protein